MLALGMVCASLASSLMLVAGPAQADTLNYPNSNASSCGVDWCVNGSALSSRGYYYRNCTDYVAWKLQSLGVPDSKTRGLHNGGQWADYASQNGLTWSSTPKAGTAAVKPGNPGHVAFVESVNPDGTITVSEYNRHNDGVGGTWTGSPASRGFTKFVDFGVNVTTPPPPSSGNDQNGSPLALAGKWTSSSTGQDFAYVTKNGDGGFSVAVMKSTAGSSEWQGVWWTQSASSGLTFNNTAFIPADADGDGLMDLYYASAPNWSNPGFTVGLMHNTGSGFTYAGTAWSASGISLATTKFLPGDWVGNGRQGFAYVTPGVNNGFNVAVMASVPGTPALEWRNTWWSQSGSSGVQLNNTVFTPTDYNGDGKMDLLYSTATNWSSPGFSMGLMLSSGSTLNWGGTVWSPTGIKLSDIRFIPGYWTGTAREGFAYVTRNSDNGFSVAVYDSTPGGLNWRGVWWTSSGSSGVQYANTFFSPVDTNGEGTTDLLYTTAINWSAPGFTTALMRSNIGASTFDYSGSIWSQEGLSLSSTQFLSRS